MIHLIYPVIILVIIYYALEYFIKPPTVSDKYPDIATIKESIAFCKDISYNICFLGCVNIWRRFLYRHSHFILWLDIGGHISSTE